MERLGDGRFITFANEALVKLEKRYAVTTPIDDPLQKLTNWYYRRLEVFQVLNKPRTVDKHSSFNRFSGGLARILNPYFEFDRFTCTRLCCFVRDVNHF